MRRRFMNTKTSIDVNLYLTIEALEDGLTASLSVNACEYCIDGDGNWKSLATGVVTESINTGQTLSFRGDLTPNISNGIGTFTINKKCDLKGNCMSMLFGDNAADNYSLDYTYYTFMNLFNGCSTIKSVSADFLPATTLSDECYYGMFEGCTSLTTAPELPATTLASNCYSRMFYNCTSLTSAPALPATTLAGFCYQYMFYNCTSLVTAPELPATTLAIYCYDWMFYNCKSLATAPELPAKVVEEHCYCSMFERCTSLTTAPELPATTLASNCYSRMFMNCSNLNYIKALFTTTPSSSYTSYWVNGVAATGTFVKNKKATWNVTGVNGVPSGWTVKKE